MGSLMQWELRVMTDFVPGCVLSKGLVGKKAMLDSFCLSWHNFFVIRLQLGFMTTCRPAFVSYMGRMRSL